MQKFITIARFRNTDAGFASIPDPGIRCIVKGKTYFVRPLLNGCLAEEKSIFNTTSRDKRKSVYIKSNNVNRKAHP